MATFNTASTGSQGQLSTGYSREQLDEIRAFNVNLTQAYTRSRSSRGRGAPSSRCGIARGGAAPSSRAAATMGPYTVTPSTSSRVSKPLTPPKVQNGMALRAAQTSAPFKERPFNVPAEVAQSHAPTPRGERIVSNMTPDDLSKPWIPAHLRQTSTKRAIADIVAETGLPAEEVSSDGATIPALRPRGASLVQTQAQTAFNHQQRQENVEPDQWLQSSRKGAALDDIDMMDTQTAAAPPSNIWNAPVTIPAAPAAQAGGHVRQASRSMDVGMFGAILDTKVGQACGIPAMLPHSALGSATPAGHLEQMGQLGDSRWAKPDPFGGSECRVPASTLKPKPSIHPYTGMPPASAENMKPAGSLAPTAEPFIPIGPISIYGAEPAKIVSALTGKKPALLKDSRWA